jgi:diadenosine tetraphosphate (Ap4A) HIT family hydrolase
MLQQIEEARDKVRELEETSREAAAEAIEAKAQIIAAANAAIDEIVRASGLTYGEILGQPVPGIHLSSRVQDPKPACKHSNGGEHPRYALIGDLRCTYSRGPLPGWMKREMESAGMAPDSKADRETFRQTRMVQV